MLCARCLVELRGQTWCAGCKAALIAELQNAARNARPRVVPWVLAWDVVLALLAPLGAAGEWILRCTMAYEYGGYPAQTAAQETWLLYFIVGGIGALLAVLPAIMLWQRRP